MQVKFSEIDPFVRQVLQNNLICQTTSDCVFKNIATVDSRLFYVLSGDGNVIIEDSSYPVKPHALILFPAGTVYAWHTDQARLICVNFDYTQSNSHLTQSFHPVSIDRFDRQNILDKPYFEDEPLFQKPLYIPDASFLESRIKALSENFYMESKYKTRILSLLLSEILFTIAEHVTARQEFSVGNNLTKQIISYVQNNYNKEINNQTISEEFHYSAAYINRILKKQLGKTVHEFLLKYRLDMAKDVLKNSDLPISEVALSVGFGDVPHFIKTFKKEVGMTPFAYRKNTWQGL